MKISQQGIDMIKHFEGLVLTAYQCQAGVWTIGYGHTARVKKGDAITAEQAEKFLKKDLANFEEGVNHLLSERKIKLLQHQYDMLVSFAFNLGVGALKSSTLLKKLKTGDISGAAAEFPRWVYATNPKNGLKEPNEDLKYRREAEKDIFLWGYTNA